MRLCDSVACCAAVFCFTLAGQTFAGELAIPPCYFASSGGFYVQPSPDRIAPPCWHYAPAAGCSIDLCYSRAAAATGVADDKPDAMRSWYAGDAFGSWGGAVPCPACLPAASSPAEHNRPEEIMPGPMLRGDEPH